MTYRWMGSWSCIVFGIAWLCAAQGVAQDAGPALLSRMYLESGTVLRAKAVLISEPYEPSHQYGYRIATFEVLEVIKSGEGEGLDTMDMLQPGDGKGQQGNYVNVVVITQTNISGYLAPRYEVGKEYALFLRAVAPALYARCPSDNLQREHLWSDEVATKLRGIERSGVDPRATRHTGGDTGRK